MAKKTVTECNGNGTVQVTTSTYSQFTMKFTEWFVTSSAQASPRFIDFGQKRIQEL